MGKIYENWKCEREGYNYLMAKGMRVREGLQGGGTMVEVVGSTKTVGPEVRRERGE